MQHNGWDHALKVTADGAGLVGQATRTPVNPAHSPPQGQTEVDSGPARIERKESGKSQSDAKEYIGTPIVFLAAECRR